jgi:hypothetical protein
MSIIRADNVAPSAGGTVKSLVRGVASAWANLDGTGTIALRDSQNVSSVVDNGTGDTTFNQTNAAANANFTIVTHADDDSFNAGAGEVIVEIGTRTRATTGPRIVTARYIGSSNTRTFADMEFVDFSTHGDLA